MAAAAAEAAARGVRSMCGFNYRRVPSIALAKQIIDEGRIGRSFHYRATYLQDWTISPDVPQGGAALWRLDASVAGSGVTGDLLAHSIDTAMWLNGPIARVTAKTATFVTERKHAVSGKVEPVGIDDACSFAPRMSCELWQSVQTATCSTRYSPRASRSGVRSTTSARGSSASGYMTNK